MKNLNVLITGASRGIGLELTRQTLSAGAIVFAVTRKKVPDSELEKLGRDFPTLHLLYGEVTDEASLRALHSEVARLAPELDLLVNNAGLYADGDKGFEKLKPAMFRESFELNSIAPVMVTQTFLPLLKKAKHPKLANITSLMGSIADNSSGGSYAYRMSKTALNMFVKSFSVDFPAITAINLHPGWVKTEMGGTSAPTTPAQSATGLLKVIANAKPSDSGKFYDFEGNPLSW